MSDLDKLWIAYDTAREAYLTALRATFPHAVGDEIKVRYFEGKYYIDEGPSNADIVMRIDFIETTDWGRIVVRGPIRNTRGAYGTRKDSRAIVIHRRPHVPYNANEPVVARHVQNADRRTVGPID